VGGARFLGFAEAAGWAGALFGEADFGAMPSVLERRDPLDAAAVTRVVADEVVARHLVVAGDFLGSRRLIPSPRERVAGELIGGEFLFFTGTLSSLGSKSACERWPISCAKIA